ncbi:MAG: glutamate synthase central domain-containing protein, partial [Candidatus Actinomarina sp.]
MTFNFEEKDSCGVGFIASRGIPRTHGMTLKILECLSNLDHRGAKFADGTGDGAGVLTEIPFELIEAEIAERGIVRDKDSSLALISCFFDPKNVTESMELIDSKLEEFDIELLYWRKVPTDKEILGTMAKKSKPGIYQAIICSRKEYKYKFEKYLYLFRKSLETDLAKNEFLNIHINSCSSKTVVYKGLFTATQTADFYWDLRNPLYKTRYGIFHQRFSTNTTSTWDKAQPLRMLAHNGEINTIRANYSWMKAREVDASSNLWKEDIDTLKPFIDENLSDSGQLDNAIELLVQSGRKLAHAQEMLIPSAWENNPRFTKDQQSYYQYHAFLTEPWDGPAAIVATDGKDIIAGLDRSGLRPLRWMISDRYILAASEVGICPSVEAGAYKTAQLEPGQTIRYRIENDELLDEQEVIEKLSEKNPYKEWVKNKPLVADTEFSDKPDDIKIDSFSEYFQYTPEEERLILLPMIKGDIPTGSMGNDSPLAVLSNNKPRLSRYFHQMFAQVTNPPIDPIRERFVMSTKTYLGKRGSILKETSQQANLITLESPILSKGTYDLLVSKEFSKDRSKVFDVSFNKADKNLEQFIDELCDEIYEAVINKKSLIILSDREVVKGNTIAPSLLVLGRVHQHLINKGVRLKASLIIVSGEIRDAHDLACHIAYGASAIWPYLALEKARQLSIENEELNISPSQAQENYREALNKGLLKIMSKMGICTVSSYRGSEIYEIIGLDKEITDSAFSNSFTRTEGLGYKQIEDNLLVFDSDEPFDLEIGGFYKHKKGSEPHVTSPVTVLKLQKAVRSGDRDEWNKYLESLEERDNVQIRDLFTLPDNNKIITSNDKDIPLEDIYKKFTVSSMSLGALSEEAHQALAIAMNRIGAKSGSGEGGEDPERYGTEKNSKIKQIASGRFGVTPDYLASAEEFQIKMAQGSKP